MFLPNPFRYFAFGDLFNTVLPDFVLAFAFFTSVVYAVLGRPFSIAMEGTHVFRFTERSIAPQVLFNRMIDPGVSEAPGNVGHGGRLVGDSWQHHDVSAV